MHHFHWPMKQRLLGIILKLKVQAHVYKDLERERKSGLWRLPKPASLFAALSFKPLNLIHPSPNLAMAPHLGCGIMLVQIQQGGPFYAN
jgi:hypothetical protein